MRYEYEKKQKSLIFLVGFMGVGKTSVGARLAEMLRWSFVDLDHEIEKSAGAMIKELFRNHGESHFRRLERDHLARVSLMTHTVISLGGGAFCDLENREVISRCGTAVWLDASMERLHPRIDLQSRPLAGTREEMEILLERRRTHYRQAPVHIRIEDQPIDEVAREIIEQLRENGLIQS